jgi:DNA-binding protein Fis
MTVKIVSDELITQINDQLKTVVEDAVKNHIQNMDWSHELDIYGLVQDELSQMDMLDYMDTSTLEDKISSVLEGMLSELTIQRGH